MPDSFAGFGTNFVGARDFMADISYVTTEFFTLWYFPLIPLRSFRVIETERTFRILGSIARSTSHYRTWPIPLCWKQIGSVYATIALSIGSLLGLLPAIGNQQNPGPLHDLSSNDALSTALVFAAPVWPFVMAAILRYFAKRRAGWRPYSLSEDPVMQKALNEMRQILKKPQSPE